MVRILYTNFIFFSNKITATIKIKIPVLKTLEQELIINYFLFLAVDLKSYLFLFSLAILSLVSISCSLTCLSRSLL